MEKEVLWNLNHLWAHRYEQTNTSVQGKVFQGKVADQTKAICNLCNGRIRNNFKQQWRHLLDGHVRRGTTKNFGFWCLRFAKENTHMYSRGMLGTWWAEKVMLFCKLSVFPSFALYTPPRLQIEPNESFAKPSSTPLFVMLSHCALAMVAKRNLVAVPTRKSWFTRSTMEEKDHEANKTLICCCVMTAVVANAELLTNTKSCLE